MSSNELEFVTYCIGNLSRRLELSQPEVYQLLNHANIIQGYIVPCYDALHTFGKDYLMDELIEVMRTKGIEV